MPPVRAFFIGFVLFTVAPLNAAAQQPIVADLSNHLVAITTGFAGAEVLLFGATDAEGDVVVVVRGPSTKMTLHRKSRVLGVWVNTARMEFERVPGYYALATSRPLEDIARPSVQKLERLGVEHIVKLPRAVASENLRKEWESALIRNQQRKGLYAIDIEPVVFLGNRLFRTRIKLPATVPTGTYQVQVLLLREGRVVSAQTTPLIVSKIGLEAEVFLFAHNEAAWYGIFAIVLAVMAGWAGHALFKKG